jgi:hypothetical protein
VHSPYIQLVFVTIQSKYPSHILKVKKSALFVVQSMGKAIPLQAWTGPEGFRRLRLLVFKTVGT